MDDNSNPTPTIPTSAQPATDSSPKDQGGTPQNNQNPNVIKMAEELGRLRKMEEDYKKYVEQIDPVIQTLWSDEELLKKATEIHNKRLGITPIDESGLKEPILPQPTESKEAKDTRNWAITKVVQDFYTKYDINNLPPEQ